MEFFGKNGKSATGSDVIDLEESQARSRFSSLFQIEGYWNALRGDRQMPFRSEIDTRGLKGAQEYCFVLERVSPGLARLRVAGSHLGELMGMEVRGMPITSFLRGEDRQTFGEMLEEVFETPATATVSLRSEAGFGRKSLNARMILMPVRSDLGDTSRILGGFACDDDIGRPPRKFTINRITLKPIDAKAPTQPATPERLPLDSFRAAEKPASVDTAGRTPELVEAIPGVSYLRIVT